MIKREVEFIIDKNGDTFLPRPSSWMQGWARYLWFLHLAGKRPKNASPEFWEELRLQYITFRLVEFDDGTHKVTSNW
mgnify:FL=1|tara:strand:+ start:225 stop:455 length:231 start_codon:yes stop_codon:yes gene_type:complete